MHGYSEFVQLGLHNWGLPHGGEVRNVFFLADRTKSSCHRSDQQAATLTAQASQALKLNSRRHCLIGTASAGDIMTFRILSSTFFLPQASTEN
ncbi:hypothetical protein BDDG_12574 [Blastomyces dermatitidis ATCC 18188]|uniref:Uncharacterized protein n=1 Tax=Ajellomyces dermatitidis (strain ATCC 18188 / CBS 674.68) TaxID=653446 RepID=A0A0J9HGB0_AJEDA|nr:hypothetical protein BDFG_02178 [Blastomyces dermatitidis ATCC 26199]KMW68094.1 hypothetical protein BDDG_12574 [Blastomyces dermatitidis ATCC 18188]